jgi:methionyl aminopeptidase
MASPISISYIKPSTNESEPLREGSIVNLDIALYVPFEPAGTGYHGDNSTTVAVGDIDDNSQRLLRATKEALEAGIAACGPFQPYNGIGKAISAVARNYGLTVVPELSGHGIGREYHQYPLILHTDNDDPGEMAPGTIFTIEPCLTNGNGQYSVDPQDNWSLLSADGARGAQEEHTVLITETGVEVLTQS